MDTFWLIGPSGDTGEFFLGNISRLGDGRWGQKVYLVNMIGYLVFGDYGTYVSGFTRRSII